MYLRLKLIKLWLFSFKFPNHWKGFANHCSIRDSSRCTWHYTTHSDTGRLWKVRVTRGRVICHLTMIAFLNLINKRLRVLELLGIIISFSSAHMKIISGFITEIWSMGVIQAYCQRNLHLQCYTRGVCFPLLRLWGIPCQE